MNPRTGPLDQALGCLVEIGHDAGIKKGVAFGRAEPLQFCCGPNLLLHAPNCTSFGEQPQASASSICRQCVALQGPQNHRDAPPRAGRHRPATHGPQDDRPIRCRGRSTVRGGRVAPSCDERVRCARPDPGEGVPEGASTDPTLTSLAPLIVTSARGSRPTECPRPALTG